MVVSSELNIFKNIEFSGVCREAYTHNVIPCRGANEGGVGGGGGGDTPPPIFKHSVLMVIIKSVPNQIQSPFYARSKGRDGRLWLNHRFVWNITEIIVRQNISNIYYILNACYFVGTNCEQL